MSTAIEQIKSVTSQPFNERKHEKLKNEDESCMEADIFGRNETILWDLPFWERAGYPDAPVRISTR
jgi:hypothetical protein